MSWASHTCMFTGWPVRVWWMYLRCSGQIINSCGKISRSCAEQVCRWRMNGYRCNSLRYYRVYQLSFFKKNLSSWGYIHHRDRVDSLKYLCDKYCKYRGDCRERKSQGAQRLPCNLVPMQHTFYQLQSFLHYSNRYPWGEEALSIWAEWKETYWKRGKLHTTRRLSFVRKEYIETMIRANGNSVPEFSYYFFPCWQMFQGV